MKCPLCGYSFSKVKAECSLCPTGKHCSVICCPNCHYQFILPDNSGVLNLIKKLFPKIGK